MRGVGGVRGGTMAADSTLLLSLVEEFVSGLQDSKAKDAAKGVKDGQFTVLQLVEALGLSLTSSQAPTRARGVQLLSEVLKECYGELTEREVEVLIAFYENRLKDHYVITPPVLQGLRALVSLCTTLPPGSAVSMLRSLFQDVHVQGAYVYLRCLVKLISNGVLLLYFPTELKGLGADFVFGFVQSMDGERDPRNLLLAFQIAKSIIHRGYDLGKFTEELFEVTSCYFPIDFTPPPNDPHGITKEELIQELRGVLTGTPKFAEFLLPLIIEKLDSDVPSAKLDSLQTLTACVSQYEHKDLAEFLEGLWASLRREVFQTSSENVESAGLAALTALTSCLSRSVLNSDSEDSLSSFLDLILKDCKHHLCEPDLKLVWPSAKLLQATCCASNRASHIVTAAVMPSLIDQYNSRTQVRTTTDILMFTEFHMSTFFFSILSFQRITKYTSRTFKPSFSQAFGLLLDSDIELAIDHLTRLLLIEEDGRVSAAVVECAGALAELHPAFIICMNIPDKPCRLFCSEPMAQDLTEPSKQHSHHAMRQRCLSALAAVSKQSSVVQDSTPVLLEVLSSAHTGSVSFSVDEVVLACHSLQRIAEQVEDEEETGRCFHDVIIPRLLSLALQAALQGEQLTNSNDHILLFYPSKQQGDSWSQSQMVCLLMGCVCSLPRSVEVPQIDQLLSALEEMSCTCSHQLSYTSAAKCFAGLVNKRPPGQLVLLHSCQKAIFVSNSRDESCSLIVIELDSTSSSVRIQAFTLMIWVAKALLLRYHPLFKTLTDKLFSLLDDTDLGPMAADSFSLLMSDFTDVLNRSCHADVRIMYRQRFFSENSAKLVQGFNAATQGKKKSNYLKALSNIVNKLPKQVQVTELPALLSLLLEALTCPDQGVQLSTLSCLEPVLINPPPALIQQLEALVNRLLALLCSPAMNVRIVSLRCIHALSSFPVHEVLPFRARVLRALAKPLDDKKRLVRSEAVQARGEWFLLGSPGGR
uniref:MMS19 nucleotide excision repair protein n=1 Tax=Amphiprion ocellaris TaxID=80972 RepID=A0AAQ5XGW6_AMPOC